MKIFIFLVAMLLYFVALAFVVSVLFQGFIACLVSAMLSFFFVPVYREILISWLEIENDKE